MTASRQQRGILAHIHAPSVSRYALRLGATWGMGALLVGLFVILAGTGVLLGTVYEPSLASAYNSVWEISFVYPHGQLLRSVHYLAGNAFVVAAVLHLLRIVMAGAYAGKRYHNYLYGLALLGAGFGALATGYFLPMTEIAHWALVVGLSMLEYIPWAGRFLKGLLLGGQTMENTTVVRLYVLHVVVLPLLMLGLISLHLWRLRKDQGLVKPAGLPPEELETVSYQEAVIREWTIFLAACLALLLAAVWRPVDLAPRPAPAYPPNPVKAAWFFVATQETLSYSVIWGGLAPMLALAWFFVRGPRLAAAYDTVSPRRRRTFFWLTIAIVCLYAVFTLAGLYCRGPNWTFINPWKGLKNITRTVGNHELR